MIKFILIFQMCYQLGGACTPPIQAKIFDTFYKCSLAGYLGAHKMVKSLPAEEVNRNQAMIQFWCKPRKVKDNEKKIDI